MRSRTIVVSGITAVTLLGGGVSAYAASPHHGHSRPAPHHGPAPHDPGFRHAETVTGSVANGFTTTDTQHGTVSAYTAGSSITVLSADTFSKTYTITTATKTSYPRKSTQTAIAVGDTVDIAATLSSGVDDATRINDHGTPTTATASATPTASATATS